MATRWAGLLALAALYACGVAPVEKLSTLSGVEARQLEDVAPRARVGGAALVFLPADKVLTRPPFADEKLSKRSGAYYYFLKYYLQEAQTLIAALEKAGLFDKVIGYHDAAYEPHARQGGYRFVLERTAAGWTFHDLTTGAAADVGTSSDLNRLVDRVERAGRAAAR